MALTLGATPAAAQGPNLDSKSTARHVVEITKQFAQQNDLKAVLLRVNVGKRKLVNKGIGESMSGVPATPNMHWRDGSMAIPYLTTILLQLRDEGKLSLDDKLSQYFPQYLEADKITLGMLASVSSGWNDYAQGNPAFIDALYANPFKQWKPFELLDYAFARGPACPPATCFNYSHANFIVLEKVIHKVTGKKVDVLMQRRIFRPLGLHQTHISTQPDLPSPVLHAYTADRGPYEDSTFWSPSWSIGPAVVQNSTVHDIAKAARAIGTGKLLSARSHREMFSPKFTSNLPPPDPNAPHLSQTLYYGLGLVVTNHWMLQNPDIDGYTGIEAYLPSKKISIALEVTKGPAAAATGKNYSEPLFKEIGTYLSPSDPPILP